MATLRGVVGNARARHAAQESTESVTGVFTVRNFIKVRPSEIVSGTKLKRRVNEALADDPVMERYQIGVDAYDGRVTFTGKVDSSFEAGVPRPSPAPEVWWMSGHASTTSTSGHGAPIP